MAEWFYESARVLARRIRRRELSSAELVELFLARIERVNPAVNAVVTLDAERARVEARRADELLASGAPVGPLHGLPMTVKDAFEVTGMRTTGGAKRWQEHVPARDATAVQRVRAAGAIIAGKTNIPAYTADWQSYNEIFGTTNNPWNLERTPGGSSGGAAAALAAGLTPLELGSDIAGSIRVPPAFCGVFGHKPTFGIVPARGHVPPAPGVLAPSDLVVVGPMARTADDLSFLFDIIAGPEPEQAKAYSFALPPPRAASLRGYRVAAWLDDAAFPVDTRVRDVLQRAVDTLRQAGVAVDDAHPSVDLSEVHHLYRQLLDPLMIVGTPDRVVTQLEAATSIPDPNEPTGYFARNALARHRDWVAQNEVREQLRAKLAKFFEDYDVLLCPVAQVPAFPHDHNPAQNYRKLAVNGVDRSYMEMMGWVSLATASYYPATSVPVGRASDGLPVGMQIIAPYLEDRTGIDFAGRLSELVGGFEPPPGY